MLQKGQVIQLTRAGMAALPADAAGQRFWYSKKAWGANRKVKGFPEPQCIVLHACNLRGQPLGNLPKIQVEPNWIDKEDQMPRAALRARAREDNPAANLVLQQLEPANDGGPAPAFEVRFVHSVVVVCMLSRE
jgi:hypothetical protein